MKDILFVSNGHGEDLIAGRVIDGLRENGTGGISLDAWPMVGMGRAYVERRIPLVGAANHLPSDGFATLSWRLMAADLLAGWIVTHWRQYKAANDLRRSYRLVVAVGDIVPVAAAVVMRTPFVLIGCAKSSYYNSRYDYTFPERFLLRRHCLMVFPRDRLTVNELDRAGIRNRYLGNPMMDGLEGSGDRLGIGTERTVVGMLPGTRTDADRNLCELLALVLAAREYCSQPERLTFLVAARPEVDRETVADTLKKDSRLAQWRPAASGDNVNAFIKLRGPAGMETLVVQNRFADVLSLSKIIIGMAGTANEQAIGLGIPLIVVPSAGVQGENYVKMKMKYFGPAAVAVPREPRELCRALANLLANPARCEEMGRAGRERMGKPGAGASIANAVHGILAGLPTGGAT
ncbi:MAG: hypothetical protein JW950_03720 [Deltaproteobacteria bacterium]|nr:hypothetical protein [Deltaproteobacteria bacterium]